MSDDLKPCPFCGGNAKRYYRADDSGWENTDWVGCTDGCGASTACYETKALAVTVWNTRIDTDDMADRIEELEAKLAKAVGLVDDMLEWGTWYGEALKEILHRLAELKGEK
jgi:Lar family restriction alleviation protein